MGLNENEIEIEGPRENQVGETLSEQKADCAHVL